MSITEQYTKKLENKTISDLIPPPESVLVLFKSKDLLLREKLAPNQDGVRHGKPNAVKHINEIRDSFGKPSNLFIEDFAINNDITINFSNWTFIKSGDVLEYLDCGNRRTKIELLPLSLKVSLDKKSINSNWINEFLLFSNGSLKFEHMKTVGWYVDATYLQIEDIMREIISGNYDFDTLMKPHITPENEVIKCNQETNFKEQLIEYVNMWDELDVYNEKSAKLALYNMLYSHKITFTQTFNWRDFGKLNWSVPIQVTANIINTICDELMHKIDVNHKLYDEKFSNKLKGLRLTPENMRNSISEGVRYISENLALLDESYKSDVNSRTWFRESLEITGLQEDWVSNGDEETPKLFNPNGYSNVIAQKLLEVIYNYVMSEKTEVNGMDYLPQITKVLTTCKLYKVMESLRIFTREFDTNIKLPAMLRPIIASYYYHDIPMTDDDLELFGFLSEADKLTVRGQGFKDFRKYNFNILGTSESKQRQKFIENPRKEIISNYFHETLPREIAYSAVHKKLRNGKVEPSKRTIDFIAGVSSGNLPEHTRKDTPRKQVKMFIKSMVMEKDTSGQLTRFAGDHIEDKNGPNKDCSQRDFTVNQIAVESDVNKQLSQLKLNTAELKQDYFKNKVDFWNSPTGYQMYNNLGVFEKLSFTKNDLEKEMTKLKGNIFEEYYESSINNYLNILREENGVK